MNSTENKQSIRNWWANAPMTYAAVHGSTCYQHGDGSIEDVQIGSLRFYELADAVFTSWNTPLHGSMGPFSNLFPFAEFKEKNVLEVGCGMGFMAMQWAKHGANLHAIDLNPVSVANTRHRFATFNLKGDIQEADGENLPFADNYFNYAYSWGVLHHTPGTGKAIAELYRVLKPGGSIGLMLYNRKSFLARYTNSYAQGYVNMESLFLNELELQSRYGDGHREEGNHHTWPVTEHEVHQELLVNFKNIKIKKLGTDISPILWQWLPECLQNIPLALTKALARRWGWSLWITATKAS